MNNLELKSNDNEETINKILEIIKHNTDEIVPVDELKNKLINAYKNKTQLTIKLGADPSAPDIHLGHTVVLNKLRDFQDLGHKIIFIIGDFTALIGDPSGKSKTRKVLSEETIKCNLETYKKQIFKILDPTKTEIRLNSEWYNKMSVKDFIRLTSNYTLAQIIERDDFSKRFKSNQPISISELIYSILQGYDSVYINSDVEIGGTDQKFNLLVGRYLQKSYNKSPQVCITMPIIEGLDGSNKMSKSLNNYIGVNENPNDMFGKVMSISDTMMLKYFKLLLPNYKNIDKSIHPKTLKLKLAYKIVNKYYNIDIAQSSLEYFEQIFKKRNIPNDCYIVIQKYDKILNKLKSLDKPEVKQDINNMISYYNKISKIIELNVKLGASVVYSNSSDIIDLIQDTKLVSSKTEIRRLINSKSVKINNDTININNTNIFNYNSEHLHNVKIGKKRFFKFINTYKNNLDSSAIISGIPLHNNNE